MSRHSWDLTLHSRYYLWLWTRFKYWSLSVFDNFAAKHVIVLLLQAREAMELWLVLLFNHIPVYYLYNILYFGECLSNSFITSYQYCLRFLFIINFKKNMEANLALITLYSYSLDSKVNSNHRFICNDPQNHTSAFCVKFNFIQ